MFGAAVVGGTAVVIVVAHWITDSWAVGATAGVIAGVLSTVMYPILSASSDRRASIPETHSAPALPESNPMSIAPPAGESERAERSQMLWTGILISTGAVVGMILGLLIAGGAGIALGICFGAGVGVVVGAAIDATSPPSESS